jgi:hypothetical protein
MVIYQAREGYCRINSGDRARYFVLIYEQPYRKYHHKKCQQPQIREGEIYLFKPFDLGVRRVDPDAQPALYRFLGFYNFIAAFSHITTLFQQTPELNFRRIFADIIS